MIWVLALWSGGVAVALAQIDPTRRELIQLGYTLPIESSGPLAGYAFYYLNKPFTNNHTNLTLRLAVAPVYVDSELGISQALNRKTDLGIGLAGGGFGDSYSEVRQGDYIRADSFYGHSGEISSSLYHLFNPGRTIPLYAVLRGAAHYSAFTDESKTADNFVLPEDQFSFRVRSGLRWGGREPVMMPELAMEISAWYEGDFRTAPGLYGFNGDRELGPDSHLVWGRALLTYTFPKLQHNFGLNVTGGTGWELDRLSAYRLGGNLPLYSEFPLTLPGYYFQELTARSFVLFGGNYLLPLDPKQQWRVNAMAATAYVDYLPGLEQPGHWNTGAGGGIAFRSPSRSWQVAVAYGYGFNAIRNHSRGAQSVTFILQFDLGRTIERFYDPGNLNRSRGLNSIFRNVFR